MRGDVTNNPHHHIDETRGNGADFLPARGVRAGLTSAFNRLLPEDRQSAQSMIEFAFTLVIILILLVGLIDLGRAIFTYLALRDAAQEGASFASYNPVDISGIEARVCNSSNMVNSLCTSPGIDTQVTVIGSACNGNGIEVRVTINNFTLVTPFLGAIVGSQTIPISAWVTDTILAPPCN